MLVLSFVGLFALWVSWNFGGMTPDALPFAARLIAIALGIHLFTLARRSNEGFGVQVGIFIFLPWIFWLLLDSFFFSPKPWLAEHSLIVNLMVVGVFILSLYHLRHPWFKWLVGGVIAAFVCLTCAASLGRDVRLFAWLIGRLQTEDIAPLTGVFGSTAGAGAALLMVFFPCCAITFGYRWRYWQRWLCAALALVALIGILATFHLGVLGGFFVGGALLAFFVIREWPARIAFILAAAALAVFFAQWAQNDVGTLTAIFSDDLQTARDAAALAGTAGDCLGKSPLQGAGTGGFAAAFEFSRPARWTTNPATPGSLPLVVFAEHGLVGGLFLFAPMLCLWGCAAWRCLRSPVYESVEKPIVVMKHDKNGSRYRVEKFAHRPPMPTRRLWLGSVLAGTAAAATVLLVDYPGPMPATACLFALLGASLLRVTDFAPLHATPGPIVRYTLFAATAVAPTLWLLWTLAPLRSAKLTAIAAETLAPLLPDITVGGATAPGGDALRSHAAWRVSAAEDDALAAIRDNPSNGDAWNLLATAKLCQFIRLPDGGKLAGEALFAADEALRHAPDEHNFHLTRAAALRAGGQPREALAALQQARELAPRNIITLTTLANAFSQLSDGSPEWRGRERTLWETANKLYPGNKIIQRGFASAALIGSTPPPANTTPPPPTPPRLTPTPTPSPP
jgi:hypothetical protein